MGHLGSDYGWWLDWTGECSNVKDAIVLPALLKAWGWGTAIRMPVEIFSMISLDLFDF